MGLVLGTLPKKSKSLVCRPFTGDFTETKSLVRGSVLTISPKITKSPVCGLCTGDFVKKSKSLGCGPCSEDCQKVSP